MFISRTTREERVTIERRLNMLTMKETEAAYARFLSETNCKRLPKTADALFTQLEKQLRTLDENKTDGYFPAIAAALFRMVKAVSRNRVFAFGSVDLADCTDMRVRRGMSVNDVYNAAVAGAIAPPRHRRAVP